MVFNDDFYNGEAMRQTEGFTYKVIGLIPSHKSSQEPHRCSYLLTGRPSLLADKPTAGIALK